jgi:hypothetical protein
VQGVAVWSPRRRKPSSRSMISMHFLSHSSQIYEMHGESSSSSLPRRSLNAAINHQAGHLVLIHFAAGVTASRR